MLRQNSPAVRITGIISHRNTKIIRMVSSRRPPIGVMIPEAV